MNHSKTISLLMLFLVISIPMNSAIVFGLSGEIDHLEFHGTDDVHRFIRNYNDSLEIDTTVQMLDDDGNPIPVRSENVMYSINDGANKQFDSCAIMGDDWYRCTYKGSPRDWTPAGYTLKVKLYDDALLRLAQKTDNLFVDVIPPEIKTYDLPSSAANQEFVIDFSAIDLACDTCESSCIGFDRIEFVVGDEVKHTWDLDGGCSYSGTLSVNPGELNIDEGTNTACLVLYDRGGLFDEKCDFIYVDYDAPEIVAGSIKMLDQDGNEVSFSSNLIMTVDIQMQLQEFGDSGISEEDLLGNFSSLYPLVPDSYNNVPASSCEQNDTIYTCVWEDINVRDVEDEEAELTFRVTDNAGNKVIRTVSLSLPLDSNPPVVKEIKTDNSKYLKENDNEIIAVITDSGSGMSSAEIYMNLRDVNNIYGSQQQADECIKNGNDWNCYWHEIDASDRADGSEVKVYVSQLEDDSGISFLPSQGAVSATLIYDDESPVVNDLTLKPLGTDIEVLMDGDIVDITALILEEYSGISRDRVWVNYGDMDPELNWTTANDCELVNSSNYRCKWEYAGYLSVDDWVYLDVKVMDDAGNEVMELDKGEAYVAEVKEQEVDLWMEKAGTRANTVLNPNFLWMSSSGTVVRANVYLARKTGDSYVHSFDITDCKGRLVGGESVDYENYEILGQYYYPDLVKTKYILINVPGYDKEKVEQASSVEIVCTGEVLQARSQFGAVYKPNEIVNATINVQLLSSGLFNEPGVTTLNKINYERGQIQQINKIIQIMDGLSFLKTLCQAVSSVKNIVNNACIMWGGIKALTSMGNPNDCDFRPEALNYIWYGDLNDDQLQDSKGNARTLDEYAESGDLNGQGIGPLKSSKNFISLGFICDLYLCTECGKQWNKVISGFGDEKEVGFLDKISIGMNYGEGQDLFNFGSGNFHNDDGSMVQNDGTALNTPGLEFDPFRNLPVAILCMPPCLEGIKNNLNVYKQILVDYNVCMNAAAIRGYGSAECEEFKSTQTCAQVVRWLFFTDTIAKFIIDYIANTLFLPVDAYVSYVKEQCSGSNGPNSMYTPECAPLVIMSVLEWFLVLEDTVQQIEKMQDLELSFQNENQVMDEVEGDLDSEGDYGSLPYLN